MYVVIASRSVQGTACTDPTLEIQRGAGECPTHETATVALLCLLPGTYGSAAGVPSMYEISLALLTKCIGWAIIIVA